MARSAAPVALQRSLPASPAALPRVRGLVKSFAAAQCGADPDQAALIALAVTEAASNVVRHAYPDRPGMIDLRAESEDDQLRIRIADAGVGLGAPSPERGLGAGLRIMQGLAETRLVSEPGRGTAVELVFCVPRGR
ncbi:MAG TPA: ATP-binding protein [Gaiellales bacterium]|jgi:anti-sigma regulatory factor (Ser/Thr protein kinase)|nr:ATP-binding protein [Gaiellales bacterium]